MGFLFCTLTNGRRLFLQDAEKQPCKCQKNVQNFIWSVIRVGEYLSSRTIFIDFSILRFNYGKNNDPK